MASLFGASGKRSFDSLSEQEILALAIAAEEEDASIYRAYAEGLRPAYPASARIFDGMAAEEDGHRSRLIEAHLARFGPQIPLLRRDHVTGYPERRPDWLARPLSLAATRAEARRMEMAAARFYHLAAGRSSDAATRKLLGDLAAAESVHVEEAARLETDHLTPALRASEDEAARRQVLLTWVQPGLAGLMDGSVSTLAPIFATAFATGNTWHTFLVGLSASVGAGISMGFTEAAHDDGRLSGRGAPWKRGLASGLMTTVGGLGHALPYLIPDFRIATVTAIAVVFAELWAITWIQHRFMQTPWLRAGLQVLLGGSLVLAAGILIGSS
jgi:rubrerythrin